MPHSPTSNPHLRFPSGFTLIELLVVIAVLGLLTALLLPVLSRTLAAGRATACLSNLHQIGLALQTWVQEHQNRMPIMYDGLISTNTSLPLTNRGPTIDIVLSNNLGSARVFLCPADHQDLFRRTGSSYAWNSLLNGQHADHLQVFNAPYDPHSIPVVFDKEAFHRARGPGRGVNYLYADGHIKNLLTLEGTK